MASENNIYVTVYMDCILIIWDEIYTLLSAFYLDNNLCMIMAFTKDSYCTTSDKTQ